MPIPPIKSQTLFACRRAGLLLTASYAMAAGARSPSQVPGSTPLLGPTCARNIVAQGTYSTTLSVWTEGVPYNASHGQIGDAVRVDNITAQFNIEFQPLACIGEAKKGVQYSLQVHGIGRGRTLIGLGQIPRAGCSRFPHRDKALLSCILHACR